jgi:uncharacterized membrane protein YdbT with pleckstrin-like domain
MSYVDDNLIAGERVLYRSHLHWLILVPPALLFVLWVPLSWYMAQGEWQRFAWIPLALGIVVLLPAVFKRQSSEFAVTSQRVLVKLGVFSTRSIELFLNKVEAIAVSQSLFGKLLGYGDIVITGSGGTHEAFSMLQGPLAFRQAVQAATAASVTAAPGVR